MLLIPKLFGILTRDRLTQVKTPKNLKRSPCHGVSTVENSSRLDMTVPSERFNPKTHRKDGSVGFGLIPKYRRDLRPIVLFSFIWLI